VTKILIFAGVLIFIYAGVFLVPDSVDKFALVPEKAHEVWRFITYSFAHLNINHLVENILGLGMVAFIAFELKTAFSDFTASYLSSGFLSVIPVWLLMSFTVLGASNAIFGSFGMISQETKKYGIKGDFILLFLAGIIFMKSVNSLFSHGPGSQEFIFAFRQGLAHFSGLVFGSIFFILLTRLKPVLTKRKRYILRGDHT